MEIVIVIESAEAAIAVCAAVAGFLAALCTDTKHKSSEKHEYHNNDKADAALADLQRNLSKHEAELRRLVADSQQKIKDFKEDAHSQQAAVQKQNAETQKRIQQSLADMEGALLANSQQLQAKFSEFEKSKLAIDQYIGNSRQEIQQQEAIRVKFASEMEAQRSLRHQQDLEHRKQLEEAKTQGVEAQRRKQQEYDAWQTQAGAEDARHQTKVLEQVDKCQSFHKEISQQLGQYAQSWTQNVKGFLSMDKEQKQQHQAKRKEVEQQFSKLAEYNNASEKTFSLHSRTSGMGSICSEDVRCRQKFQMEIAPAFPGCDLRRAKELFDCGDDLQAEVVQLARDLQSGAIRGNLGTGCSEVCPLIAFLQADDGELAANSCTRVGKCDPSCRNSKEYCFTLTFDDPSKMKVVSFAPHVANN